MHAVISLLLKKLEILVISLTDFFGAASQRHIDVKLLPAIRRVSGNDFVPAEQFTDTSRRARATVELLRQETADFLASNLWPPCSQSQSCGLQNLGRHAASCLPQTNL